MQRKVMVSCPSLIRNRVPGVRRRAPGSLARWTVAAVLGLAFGFGRVPATSAAEYEILATSATIDSQLNLSSAAYFQKMTLIPLAPNAAGVTNFAVNANPGGLYWNGTYLMSWDYTQNAWVSLATASASGLINWYQLNQFPPTCSGGNVLTGFSAAGAPICVTPGGAGLWTTYPSDANTGIVQVNSGPVTFNSSVTVQGNAFSVGGSSFTVGGGSATVAYQLSAGQLSANQISARQLNLSANYNGIIFPAGQSITDRGNNNLAFVSYSGGASPSLEFDAGSGGSNQSAYFNVPNGVGINVSVPAYPLHVAGAAYVTGEEITGGTMTVQGNAFSVGGSTFVVATSSVGIGTNNPQGALDVRGSICLGGVCNAAWPGAGAANGSGTQNYISKWTVTGNTLGNSLIFDNGTNLGVGTTNPAAKLHVSSGTVYIDGNAATGLQVFGSTFIVNSNGNVGIGTISPSASLHVKGNVARHIVLDTPSGATVGPAMGFDQNGTENYVIYNPAGTTDLRLWSGADKVTFQAGGNVGIGTTNPAVPLDVKIASNFHFGAFANTAGATSIGAFNDGFSAWQPLSINPGGQVWLLGGNVGIGTTSPNKLLHLYDSVNSANDYELLLQNFGGGNNTAGISFQVTDNSVDAPLTATSLAPKAAITYQRNAQYGRGDIHFINRTTGDTNAWDSAADTKMIILNNGNVGIGITAPLGRLDVQGATARTGTAPTTPSFYVTGTLNDGKSGPQAGNIEFRHDNQSQGIGFGFNTIYQTGYNTNQDLNFLSRGSSPLTLNAYPYSTGNVGVGTTNPAARFSVLGNGIGSALIGANGCGGNYTGISLSSNVDTGCGNGYNMLSSPTDLELYINRPTGHGIHLRENNSDQMIVQSGGAMQFGWAGGSADVGILESTGGIVLPSNYSPVAPYDVATKKYVDNWIGTWGNAQNGTCPAGNFSLAAGTYQYSTCNITGILTLTGTPVIIKAQSSFTLGSGASITGVGVQSGIGSGGAGGGGGGGAYGGAGTCTAGTGQAGAAGSASKDVLVTGQTASGGTGGAGGTSGAHNGSNATSAGGNNVQTDKISYDEGGYVNGGSQGGAGGQSPAAGGLGGGGLTIAAPSVTIAANTTINVSGAAGANANFFGCTGTGGTPACYGAAGGGGGGSVYIYTFSSVATPTTLTKSGGAGGGTCTSTQGNGGAGTAGASGWYCVESPPGTITCQ